MSFYTKNAQQNWGKHIFQPKTLFPHFSLVYGQKSCLKWPILTNLLCFGLFYPKIGLLSKFGGLRFSVPFGTLKIHKMAIFGWSSLKSDIWGLYTTKFCMKKKIPNKIYFWARQGSKSKNVKIFGNKHEKCHFLHKKCPKNGKNIFSCIKHFS